MAPADLPAALIQETEGLSIVDTLRHLTARFPGAVTFSSSFSYEDQVVTHLIATNKLAVQIFTLDTGRLFAETYNVWTNTNAYYDLQVKAYYPDHGSLEPFLQEHGPNAFYTSQAHRQTCCTIRKVAPLKRALKGNAVWVTGLRAEHSPDRKASHRIAWDEHNNIIKFNPLIDWTTDEVIQFIREHHVPYNSLHDRGFISIGCAPCTRAIRPGEDFRAGRWWWEYSNKKECGLHTHK